MLQRVYDLLALSTGIVCALGGIVLLIACMFHSRALSIVGAILMVVVPVFMMIMLACIDHVLDRREERRTN